MTAPNFNIDTATDLWVTTLSAYPWKDQFIGLQELHNYPVTNQWFRQDKVSVETGTDIRWQMMVKDPGANATFTTDYTPNVLAANETMAEANLPWCRLTDNYLVTDTEIERNMAPSRLVNLLKGKRGYCLMKIVRTLEDYAWRAPTDSSDVLVPRGVPYHMVKITQAQAGTSTASGAHQGVHSSGFSDWCGLSATTYSLLRNYNATWTNSAAEMTEDDVQRIVRMLRHLNFQSPLNAEQFEKSMGGRMAFYTNEAVLDKIELKARENNDQLGADLGKYAGATLIKGLPVMWVEKLDADTTNPLYALNHDYFKVFVNGDRYFKEQTFKPTAELNHVIPTVVDTDFNIGTHNRRLAGGVISYQAA